MSGINKVKKSKFVLITGKTNNNLGYIFLCYEFITIVMEGRINGKRTRGRPFKAFIEEIFYWMDFYPLPTTQEDGM